MSGTETRYEKQMANDVNLFDCSVAGEQDPANQRKAQQSHSTQLGIQ